MSWLGLSEEITYIDTSKNAIKRLLSTPEGRAYLSAHMVQPTRCGEMKYQNEDWIFFVKAIIDYEQAKEVSCTD